VLPVAAQQPRPTLELRTTTGQTIFHIGERIPLTLTLTGPDNKKYSINTASYDRSGRLNIDTFAVTPTTGWADPLAQYFSSGVFMGGGLFGSEPLSSKPVSFPADLNEHIRFDQPGTYALTATSHRVGTEGKHGFPKEPYLSLTSNPVEIHIIPATPEWQAEKLHTTLAIVDTPVKPTPFNEPSQEQEAAIADLRYLNSPASIEVLASDLREGPETSNHLMWAAALGLSGVPDALRDTAIHAMSRQLDDPGFAVCAFFLQIMAELEATPQGGHAGLRDPEDPRLAAVWEQALASLPRKQGPALAATADTLLSEVPGGRLLGSEPGAETAALRSQVTAIVVNTLTALPIDRQIFELQNNWDELSRHPVLPLLQAVLHQAPSKTTSPFYTAGDLNTLALKRWYELDPQGAVAELTTLLASPNPALNPDSVRSLPGGPQPQFESRWARELVESEDDNRQTLLSALLVRFGTGSASVQIEAKVNSLVGKWACQPQAAALAYLVKFNSDNAASLVHRAVTSTNDTACYDTVFSYVSAYAHGSALNEAAVAALQNSNPAVAGDAAQYLRFFGTETTKQPLLDRYRQWNEQWAGKPADVDSSTPTGYPLSQLGQNLGEALIANQGWLSDPKLIAEVLSRCIGKNMCWELNRLAALASSKPTVSLNAPSPYDGYRIDQYSCKSLELFEAKLAQFPSGTKFTLTQVYPRTGDQLRSEAEAEPLFKKHGMTLELQRVTTHQ
jgi:hypothetical protein